MGCALLVVFQGCEGGGLGLFFDDACGPGYPLQVLISLRFIPGFSLLSLSRTNPDIVALVDPLFACGGKRMVQRSADRVSPRVRD